MVMESVKEISQNPYATIHDFKTLMVNRIRYELPSQDAATIQAQWNLIFPGESTKIASLAFMDEPRRNQPFMGFKIRQIVSKDLLNPSKAVTVYSGIDLSRFPEKPTQDIRAIAGRPAHAKVVVSTAAISPQKDYATFIRVAAELRLHHPDLYFVVCGEGPSEQEIKNLAAAMGLEGRVHFLGFRHDVQSFLGSADLFLITSKEEGLGTSILDAFAVGLPVVGTAAGGIPEIIHHGKTGLLAPVQDYKMLATHVENLVYMSGNLKEELKRNAHQLAAEFSYKRTGEKTLAIYREILQNS
jgi:glycosyltransferase involved in cell wall biosynthesis